MAGRGCGDGDGCGCSTAAAAAASGPEAAAGSQPGPARRCRCPRRQTGTAVIHGLGSLTEQAEWTHQTRVLSVKNGRVDTIAARHSGE